MDFPIVFSGPMVRALMDGSKTQTRRMPGWPWPEVMSALARGERCLLWVQEAIGYAPSGADPIWFASQSARWMSRLTLEVTAIRTERLHAMASEDALMSGIHGTPESGYTTTDDPLDSPVPRAATPVAAYARFWDRLHGAVPGERWADNPTVVVIDFRTLHANIDRIREQTA